MLDFDTWAYKGQNARLFRAGTPIPEGWADKPDFPFAADGEWPEVISEKHSPPEKRGPGRPPKEAE